VARDCLQKAQAEVLFLGLLYCLLFYYVCVCCLLAYVVYFPTAMARYSLFVLKVPLNTKQTNKQTNTHTHTHSRYVGILMCTLYRLFI